MRRASAAALCLALLAPIAGAQSIDDPLKALKGIMGGAAAPAPGAATAPAAAARTPAQVKAALEGLWQQSLADCNSDGDTWLAFEGGNYSSIAAYCEVPASAYNAKGYSGTIKCSAEGDEVTAREKVELSPDGKSLTMTNLENGRSQKYLKCPK